ncbi:MAG: segregation and condensation protein segregation and condensation protein [Candidatus Parcubacteria bacterium]|jgi:segregation and condensation protein A
MEFTVKLDRFEGPYTALLELIENKKLSITEISLVSVTDDYIAYVRSLNDKNVIDISQFVVVASTLMLMKAKSLFPEMVYTEEEERQIDDLEKKLELHTILKDAELGIKNTFAKSVLYSRAYKLPESVMVFVIDTRLSLQLLQSIASMTLVTFLEPKVLTKIAVEKAIRIENVIEDIMTRIKSAQTLSLQTMSQSAGTVEEKKKILITSFMAILELLKNGALSATQDEKGGDIILSKI